MDAPRTISNWNLTEKSVPAVFVEARCAEDVARVCQDSSLFPSPVLAVGSLHSVNGCITNQGGTIICLAGMNRILGLEGSGCDERVVRVQAGVKLASLHDWLAKQEGGLEISFSPEIGDASVGSLAVTTSKDSSIDGPGYFSALLREVKYVNEHGHLVMLNKAKTPAELLAFTCSYGMMGIVVEVVLAVRRRIPVTTYSSTASAACGAAAASLLREACCTSDALFAILVPDRCCLRTGVVCDARCQQQLQVLLLLVCDVLHQVQPPPSQVLC